jgi:hypothetical protein
MLPISFSISLSMVTSPREPAKRCAAFRYDALVLGWSPICRDASGFVRSREAADDSTNEIDVPRPLEPPTLAK